jgi:IS6 family transposase
LTDRRDAAAVKRFFRRALRNDNSMPRVVNVDKNPAYPRAVMELKADGTISRRCRLRQCKYLNNIVEQDHRTVKRRTWLARGYGSLPTAWRTLRGIEAMEMVRKGRAKWMAKGTVVGQVKFISSLFGIAA